MSTTLITCEVEFDIDGKRSGYLRVPYSTHRSAYGWIPVPVTVIRNGEGPTVLVIAGIHGDEYEGQIALGKLVRELEPADLQGCLIVLPAANAPAAKAGLRSSPIDNGNLNRSFPGDATGTPTQMIAHYIEEVLLPQCDCLIDLHSGGTSLFYPPTLLRGRGSTPEETGKLLEIEEAFDLPFAWEFTSGGGPKSTARTAMGAANRKGVVSVMAELGGAGAVSKDILALTERGLRRIFHRLGMLPGYEPDEARGTRVLHAQGSVYAYDAGLFEPYKDIGDTVEVDETVGVVHFVSATGSEPAAVTTPVSGMVLCKRPLGQVECGDAVFQIARDAEQG